MSRRWASACARAFEQLIPNHDDLFEEIRGKGLMLGIKMKEPAVSRDFVAHLRDNHGLLTVRRAKMSSACCRRW
jgi:acetylornithine/N-succinyldiaminopimelate aminotransferase